MAELVAILVVLWLAGVVKIPWLMRPNFPTLDILGLHISLGNVLVLILLLWILSSLGGPLRQIIWAVVILWLLSALGVIAIGGLSNLLIIGIVVGLVLSIVQRK